jgi:hypothetical protein
MKNEYYNTGFETKKPTNKQILKYIASEMTNAIKILAKTTKNTQIDITKDLESIGEDKAKEVWNTLIYLNDMDCDGWKYNLNATKIAMALYLTLTSWSHEFGIKYHGETSDKRLVFIRNFNY